MRIFLTLCLALTLTLSFNISAMADSTKGQGVYMNFCASCHASGIAGAPKVGDKANWQKRTQKGLDVITKNALEGFQGKTGYMPAKGGNSALTDEEVSSAVLYMLELSK